MFPGEAVVVASDSAQTGAADGIAAAGGEDLVSEKGDFLQYGYFVGEICRGVSDGGPDWHGMRHLD